MTARTVYELFRSAKKGTKGEPGIKAGRGAHCSGPPLGEPRLLARGRRPGPLHVFDGVCWPHWNGFAWPHFWAVWVMARGGAGEERYEVAPPPRSGDVSRVSWGGGDQVRTVACGGR